GAEKTEPYGSVTQERILWQGVAGITRAPARTPPVARQLGVGRNQRPRPPVGLPVATAEEQSMIRKLKTGQYRLYSRKIDPSTGKRRNLGTFESRAAAEKHE